MDAAEISLNKSDEAVRIETALLNELLTEARATPDVECCGLLAGRDGVITVILPSREGPRSASSYEIPPRTLFSFFHRMRSEHLDHLGIYHSHPRGENSPTARDVALAYYPDAAYLIISPQEGVPRPVRAFRIADGGWSELAILTV